MPLAARESDGWKYPQMPPAIQLPRLFDHFAGSCKEPKYLLAATTTSSALSAILYESLVACGGN
jgi:hypothetical protein